MVAPLTKVVKHADASPAVDWASAIRPTLVHALCHRFRLTSDRCDLDRAITEARRGGDDRPTDLLVLSHALVLRSETTGSRDDADRAEEAIGETLALLPAESPQRDQAYSLLGDVFRAKGEMFGDVADLDAAVDAYREAGRAQNAKPRTLSGVRQRAAHPLPTPWRDGRHRRSRDAEPGRRRGRADARPARAAEPVRRRPPVRSLPLGVLGDPGDLDEAIEAGQAAVRAVSAGHTLRPTYLAESLGMAHIDRFRERRTESDAEAAEDVDAAIGLLREAVATVPPGHRLRPA
ncbi:hypothetical protein [Streptomyces sp. DHE17-7]|uniref:hypothetical protein n=1 Tax=Streptomyces sp. DHE17-7 TaxID=2759949 RepID=UPI0022EB639C|nr:hypothetical protein [Streptomyces sp. DHE17-7]MBJ6623476.1 hypothetical protein [Streptomyces sp. DHE17-7]